MEIIYVPVYTTAELLASTQHHFKFDPLFLRLFFRETYPFTTEKVYLSQIPGLVNMALYVSPIVSGECYPIPWRTPPLDLRRVMSNPSMR
ncbi:major capsid protein [Escherichia coli]